MFKELHNPKTLATAAFTLAVLSGLSAYDGHTDHIDLQENHRSHAETLQSRFTPACEKFFKEHDHIIHTAEEFEYNVADCARHKANALVDKKIETASNQRSSMLVFSLILTGVGISMRKKHLQDNASNPPKL